VVTVDGAIAFVSGLCVSSAWEGDAARGVAGWRDTGVALRGPAVADVDRAFAETWAAAGAPLPEDETMPAPGLAGSMDVRVIMGRPGQLAAYRLDQLIAAASRHSLWLTDAYFVATSAYVQALTAAARDGVDVRLLVPGSSDVPPVQALARTGYRPLIEAGVRIFEWNGPMLHAKTAVADGRWARVGSTNLNLTSWLTNWELDVTVEDAGFAAEMAAMFEDDLAHATEIVEIRRRGVRRAAADMLRDERARRPRKGSGTRLAAGALGLGSTAGAAITGSRSLAATETRNVAWIGCVLLTIALLALVFPRLVAVPVVLLSGGLGGTLLARAWRLRRERDHDTAPAGQASPPIEPSGPRSDN
jgi:cardiolipin synthase A/B